MAARGYNTAAYRRMKALLATNAIPCHWCSVARATQPDHLVPLALGGGDDDLVPSCGPCNAKRGAQLGARLKRARRANRRSVLHPWP